VKWPAVTDIEVTANAPKSRCAGGNVCVCVEGGVGDGGHGSGDPYPRRTEFSVRRWHLGITVTHEFGTPTVI
jgi:hypothetical protein